MPTVSCRACRKSFNVQRCTKGETVSCPKCGLTRPVKLAGGRLVLEKDKDYATRSLCYGAAGLLCPVIGLVGILYGFAGQRHGQKQSFCTAGIALGILSWLVWLVILSAWAPFYTNKPP